MPNRHRTFVRQEVFPSYIPNTILAALSTLAENFRLQQVAGSDTTIEVPAGAGDALVSIAIDGRLRWNEATTQRAHPGGPAGLYRAWATTTQNSIVNAPAPNTDLTDYAFELRITPDGQEPAVVAGDVELWREVGNLDWDGAKITALRQTVGDQGPPLAHAASHVPGGSDALDLTVVHRSGTYAARPPASAALNGVRYFATDNATEWQCVAGAWVLIRDAVPVEPNAGYSVPVQDYLMNQVPNVWSFFAAEAAQALAVPNGQTWLYQFTWKADCAFDITYAPSYSAASGPVLLSSAAGGVGAGPTHSDRVWRSEADGDSTSWQNQAVLLGSQTVAVAGAPGGRWVRMAYSRDAGVTYVRNRSLHISAIRRLA